MNSVLFAALLAGLFDYDPNSTLDIQTTVFRDHPTHTVHDITFASPKGGRVTAYLVVPKAKGPHAGVVFGHWGSGNRTEFLPEAELYARAGVVSIMIDYPWTRPNPWWKDANDVDEPEKARELQIQAVIDLRRAIDLLLARPDVDKNRIGYAGHSYGAQWGAILSATDQRLKAAVLIGGTPDGGAIFQEGTDPGIEQYKIANREKIERSLKVLKDLNAINYVSQSKIPLFFQFATVEKYFGEPAMKRYFAAAKEPKTVRWYDAGHDLNGFNTLADRAAWLRNHLKFAPIEPIIQEALRHTP